MSEALLITNLIQDNPFLPASNANIFLHRSLIRQHALRSQRGIQEKADIVSNIIFQAHLHLFQPPADQPRLWPPFCIDSKKELMAERNT